MKHSSKPGIWPTYTDPISGQPLLSQVLADGSPSYQTADGTSSYPVKQDIPRLLQNPDNYANAFGEQWLRWRKTQLDSFSGTQITEDRLNRCLGKDVLRWLETSEQAIQILEVGCGAGRFTEVLLKHQASCVTSVDLSVAVEANVQNCPQDHRHRVVQADVMTLPFAPQQYDLVLCLGVIQHTPDSHETIRKLYDQVKPGGYLVIDHYTFQVRRLTKITANVLRPWIKRMPSERRIQVVEKLVDVFFPIHRAIRNIPFAQQVFSRISPITTYFHAYPQLPEPLQREWAVLDTHDGLTDWFKRLLSLEQIKTSLMQLGAQDIHACKAGNGIEARCRRPQ